MSGTSRTAMSQVIEKKGSQSAVNSALVNANSYVISNEKKGKTTKKVNK